jgi:hypothetical protein
MAREDHRCAVVRGRAQHARKHVDPDRIEAGERLVEHQQLRPMHQRGGELHALLVAERQRLDARAGIADHLERREQLVRARARLRLRHAAQTREVYELLEHAHLRIQAAFLRHVSEPAPDRGVDGATPPPHLPRVCLEHAERDPHRRRLAGAVASDETHDAAFRNGERDAVERDDVSEAAVQVDELKHGPGQDTARPPRNPQCCPRVSGMSQDPSRLV